MNLTSDMRALNPKPMWGATSDPSGHGITSVTFLFQSISKRLMWVIYSTITMLQITPYDLTDIRPLIRDMLDQILRGPKKNFYWHPWCLRLMWLLGSPYRAFTWIYHWILFSARFRVLTEGVKIGLKMVMWKNFLYHLISKNLIWIIGSTHSKLLISHMMFVDRRKKFTSKSHQKLDLTWGHFSKSVPNWKKTGPYRDPIRWYENNGKTFWRGTPY